MKKLLLTLLFLLLTACNVLQPPPDLAWDHDPEALIIRASSEGGMEPEAAYYNRIPDGQVWGDGRIIWTTQGENGGRLVWQGQLSEDEMADLLQTFAGKGFWRLKNHYQPKEEIFDAGSASLRVNLLAESKSVSEYASGAPRAFHELLGLVRSGAGAAAAPYEPQRGYLMARPVEYEGDAETAVWDAAAAGLSLDDATGIWVEGAALTQAWDAVNQKYWAPLIVEGNQYYELYLQMPELTGRDPS